MCLIQCRISRKSATREIFLIWQKEDYSKMFSQSMWCQSELLRDALVSYPRRATGGFFEK
jgi:hypothetical protein